MILSEAETEEPENCIPWAKKCREMSHGGYVLMWQVDQERQGMHTFTYCTSINQVSIIFVGVFGSHQRHHTLFCSRYNCNHSIPII